MGGGVVSSDILGIPNPIKIVGGLLGGAASTVAGSVFAELAKLVVQALNKALASMATLWVKVSTPQLATAPGGSRPSASVAYIQGHLWFLMTAAAVMGVIAGCARMVWEQRADAGRDVLRGLVVYVLVSGAGLAVISLAVQAADGFSSWIIGGAVARQSFGSALTELIGLTGAGANALGLLLVILFGLLALLASVIQIVLMVIRGGMLVLLAGVLPTCASFTATQTGRQWFRKAAGWLVAFVLYKPAAAIVYATAIRLSSSGVFGPGGLVGVITGLTLMLVALLALPALMRFVVPMVGAVASGGAGAMIAAGAGAATVAMPSGAVRATGVGAGAIAALGAGGSGPGDGGGGALGRTGPPGSQGTSGGGDRGLRSDGDGASAAPGLPARSQPARAPAVAATVPTGAVGEATAPAPATSPSDLPAHGATGDRHATVSAVPAAAAGTAPTQRVPGSADTPAGGLRQAVLAAQAAGALAGGAVTGPGADSGHGDAVDGADG